MRIIYSANRRTFLAAFGSGAFTGAIPLISFANALHAKNMVNRKAIKVPFEIPDDNHIVVSAKIGALAADIVIDSGVDKLVIDAAFARKLGLTATETVRGIGLSGTIQGALVQPPPIRIGTALITPHIATVFDLQGLASVEGHPILAILGRDLFEAFTVEINFLRREISLERDATMLTPPGESIVSLHITEHGSLSLPIQIEGNSHVLAIFDLGSAVPLLLSPDYASHINLLRSRKHSTALGAGIEGLMESDIATVRDIRLGASDIRAVPVQVPRKWSRSVPAVIGLPILERFDLRVSYRNLVIGLTPIGSKVDLEFAKDRSGIGPIREGNAFKIIHIASGSPAQAAGLKVGDAIIAINGRPLDARYFRERPRENTRPAGTVLALSLSDGSVKKIVLSDYF